MTKLAKKPNKREENKERSKELILRASLELFSMKGYGSTTLEMIADRANVSRGLPYLYFESKEKILYSILERHFTRKKQLAEALRGSYDTLDELFDNVLKIIVAPFEEGMDSDAPLEMRLIMSMMLLPDTKSIVQDWVYKFQKEIMEEYFEDIREGFVKFGIKDARKEIEYLRMMFFGYTFCRLCLGDEFMEKDMQNKIRENYTKLK